MSGPPVRRNSIKSPIDLHSSRALSALRISQFHIFINRATQEALRISGMRHVTCDDLSGGYNYESASNPRPFERLSKLIRSQLIMPPPRAH